MLAFYFKISIKKNTIKYFTVFNDFPFLLEDPKNKTLRFTLEKCFERLVTEQERNRNTPLTSKRITSLIKDLNWYIKDTGAIWRMMKEDSEFMEFQLQKLRDQSQNPVYYSRPLVLNQSSRRDPIYYTRPLFWNQSNNQAQSNQMTEMNPSKKPRLCANPMPKSSDGLKSSSEQIFRPWL